jgi:ABC-type Fe3+-hydroxamate transport system substrate-binding protein
MTSTFIDMMGRAVETTARPVRIVSLVPSQTELLYDLGLGERVIGITKFCIHPMEWFYHQSPQAKTRVGGTKSVNLATIRALNPDLIIGNKEENEQKDIEALEKEFPVWMSDIYTLDDALTMIHEVGRITQTSDTADAIINTIREIQTKKQQRIHKKALYLIWNDPILVAGKNTFIDDLLHVAGLENVVTTNRYPALTIEEISNLQPEVILLSSEPFPFNHGHQAFFKQHLPNSQVVLVDGEAFSWYGSRLIKSLEYLIHLDFSQFEK